MSRIYTTDIGEYNFMYHVHEFIPFLSTLNDLDIIPSIDIIYSFYVNNNDNNNIERNIDISCSSQV